MSRRKNPIKNYGQIQLAVSFINDLQMALKLLPNGVPLKCHFPLIQAICLFGRNEIGLDCRWSKLQIEVAYGLKNIFKLCSKVKYRN